MPPEVCLRAVDFSRWAEPKPAAIAAEDAPAWCLKDLSPGRGDGNLSLYLIPADQADQLAPVVAAAVAAQRPHLDHAEYVLFEAPVLGAVGLTVVPSPGDTPLAEVNRLHADVPISARGAATLAGAVYGKADLRRTFKTDVTRHLRDAHRDGRLDISRIASSEVKKELGV